VAIQLLGFGLWALLAVAGAWLLVTGRPLPLGLPDGLTKAWHLRVFGLIYCVLGGYLAYRSIQGAFDSSALVMTFAIGMATAVWIAWDRRRKARNREV
jgi:hypothetical protein